MNPLKRNFSTPSPHYAAAGDLLRVFCCFMVAWYHIWQQSWLQPLIQIGGFALNMNAPVRAGYMFVDLMLLLSGFLLYLPYANEKEDPAAVFYAKRGLRILPSYWLCLMVMLAFAVCEHGFFDARTWKDLLAHLSFTHNFFQFSYTLTRMNVVLWTLAVEVQFYLLLPLIAPLFRKKPYAVYLIMVGMGVCFRRLWTIPMQDTTLFVNRLPNMLDVYANGMLAAHIYARLAKSEKRRGLIALVSAVVCVIGAWGVFAIIKAQARTSGYDMLRAGQLSRRWLFSACGALFIVGGSLTFAPIRAIMSNRIVRFLSGVSFNFYIWHQWLAVKLKAWRIPAYTNPDPNMAGERPWQVQYTFLCFFAALAVSILITYLVEKPCAKRGRKLIAKRTKSA